MAEKLLRDGLMLWATIDPIGTLALFASVTGGLDSAQRRRVATRATLVAGAILLLAIVLGELILRGLGIHLISLQLAGGIVLFLFALRMVFGLDSPGHGAEPEAGHDLAIFPLALPSIASPGAIMAVIVLTDNTVYSIPQQLATALVLLAILGATWLLMIVSEPLLRLMGRTGAAVLVRVMGLILAALSVELVMVALGAERWLQ
jgi:multiple antibiotic resistance protein